MEGFISDYSWVDIGQVRSPLASYIYDGARWYDKATVQFMLETNVCQWQDVKLSFTATTHQPATDLASTLKKMQTVWLEVGSSCQAEVWAGHKSKNKKKQNMIGENNTFVIVGQLGEMWKFQASDGYNQPPR